MVAPPSIPGNCENLGPRKVIIMSRQGTNIRRRSGRGVIVNDGHKSGNRFQLARREIPGRIEGLPLSLLGDRFCGVNGEIQE
ncbi:88b718cc-496c-4a35-9051-90f4c51aecf4-CDS [Sclerotinia trifoliorum]|uniref:88b718cc-496c-4a35-9051-90f4c51aecf4-CDS n=1 Tax=Sclerotinia trifoliorum TaxID=28548 RepID=A0A8H2ZUI3_9HELO|nr:88b718cc-496c-4a35-9051-90f4c51aecf4-CDS [Sclerotinia trifoliorum]